MMLLAIVLFLLICYFQFVIHDAAIVLFLLFCYFQFSIHAVDIVLFLLFCSFGPPFSQEPRKEGIVRCQDFVGLWHCEKHKEATCMPYLDNPKCIYHPKLSSFSAVHCVNTECAEQAFKWLGKFKFIARKMTRQRSVENDQ